jgi:hypothetical protein
LPRERKTVSEIIGEFLREAGLLLAVFFPLDMLFSGRALGTIAFLTGMMICLACLILGVTVERLRP